MPASQNSDITAVVCTKNSISGIAECLGSLSAAGVGQIIVVDAHSTDGTAQIARELSDKFLEDAGLGLGNARNIGISHSTGTYVLNLGSDNIVPPHQLERMLETLINEGYQGVSAQTRIVGNSFIANGLNAWRQGRFRPGTRNVIGTPTLFVGDLIRRYPYDPGAKYSDDSELCERWERTIDARFGIADAFVYEIGKISWKEVIIRCHMYGVSDHEVYSRGKENNWNFRRKVKSLFHPFVADFLTPITTLSPWRALINAPFLVVFAGLRYWYWFQTSIKANRLKTGS